MQKLLHEDRMKVEPGQLYAHDYAKALLYVLDYVPELDSWRCLVIEHKNYPQGFVSSWKLWPSSLWFMVE